MGTEAEAGAGAEVGAGATACLSIMASETEGLNQKEDELSIRHISQFSERNKRILTTVNK